jgi:hypothetical protein
MSHYKVFHPDHEIRGQLLVDCENAIGRSRTRPLFEKHGLVNIDPQAWYSEQQWLDVLSDMADLGDPMFDFVSLGIKIAENVTFPPGFDSLPLLTVLQNGSRVFHMNSRGSETGEITVETLNDKHVKLAFRVPDPDDFWYGIVFGYVRRCMPKGTHFTVFYDKEIPRREQGGEVTIIHVEWA